MLDARQLGLKLIANVTYGYTAANFSGRMPCIEVNISMDTIFFKKKKEIYYREWILRHMSRKKLR